MEMPRVEKVCEKGHCLQSGWFQRLENTPQRNKLFANFCCLAMGLSSAAYWYVRNIPGGLYLYYETLLQKLVNGFLQISTFDIFPAGGREGLEGGITFCIFIKVPDRLAVILYN